MMLCTLTISAQKDVTTFLGIPVDGYKADMRKKLISKGFTPATIQGNEFFEGEFNGYDVCIWIVTSNNKVCRLIISDRHTQNEKEIKTRFNKLVSQFERNKRYITDNNYLISEDVDISYEMDVHNKNFDALYFQLPAQRQSDSLAIINEIHQELSDSYSEKELNNPSPNLKSFIDLRYHVKKMEMLDAYSKKPVWFRICKRGNDEYYVTMCYDNDYNRTDGEDL